MPDLPSGWVPGRWLVADLGNSRLKLAWAENGELVERQPPLPTGSSSFAAELRERLATACQDTRAAGAGSQGALVAATSERQLPVVVEALERAGFAPQQVGREVPVPLATVYPDRARLGIDRQLAAFAASRRARAMGASPVPVVVVDAGTAVTLDLVDAGGTHRGGFIAPGLGLALDALDRATALPVRRLEPRTELPPLLGEDTDACLASGAWNCLVAGVVDAVQRALPSDGVCYVAGGDHEAVLHALRERLPHLSAHAAPDLVLEGLALLSGATEAPA